VKSSIWPLTTDDRHGSRASSGDIAELLTRPVGRPSHKPVASRVQEFPVPSRYLEDSAARGGQGEVLLWRIVSVVGLAPHQPQKTTMRQLLDWRAQGLF